MNAGPHIFWITSRAAGSAALVVASLSVCLGIVMGRRRTGNASLTDLRSLHEALSLSTLALLALHGFALLGDHYLSPGVAGIAVPFAGAYRPLWTGVGIIGAYGLAAVSLSYYARDRIGPARWKRLHRFTALFWALGVAHSIGAGTDAATPWFLALLAIVCLPAAVLVVSRTAESLRTVFDRPRAAHKQPEPDATLVAR